MMSLDRNNVLMFLVLFFIISGINWYVVHHTRTDTPVLSHPETGNLDFKWVHETQNAT